MEADSEEFQKYLRYQLRGRNWCVGINVNALLPVKKKPINSNFFPRGHQKVGIDGSMEESDTIQKLFLKRKEKQKLEALYQRYLIAVIDCCPKRSDYILIILRIWLIKFAVLRCTQ